MSDLSIAAKILEEARKVAAEGERQNSHGDTAASFNAIAEMWTVYLKHTLHVRHKDAIQLDGSDVAQMMSLLKKVRTLFGGATLEHPIDDVGYTSLAGMLAMSNRPRVVVTSPQQPNPAYQGLQQSAQLPNVGLAQMGSTADAEMLKHIEELARETAKENHGDSDTSTGG